MELNRTPNPLDRNARNGENDNWERIERGIKRIDDTISDLVLESGGDSNLEVVQARGGKPVLNDRLNEFDSKLAGKGSLADVIHAVSESTEAKNKSIEALAKSNNPLGAMQSNGTKIPLDMLGNDVIEAMTGNTEITNAEGYLENNRGVTYPLKNITRGGELYGVSQAVKDVILDVKIINPRPNKYYRINFISNGFSDSWGFSLSEYDKDTYVTDGVGEYLCRYNDEVGSFDEPTNDIITQRITIDNMIFLITVDYSKITGVSLNVDASFHAQGAIVDESCYLYNYSEFYQNKILYPFKNVKKNGVFLNYSEELKEILLDAKVINAERGYYYFISYISNGLNERYGLTIKKAKKEEFESTDTSNGFSNIFHISDSTFEGFVGEGVTVVNLEADNDLRFVLTIDYSKIKGDSINLSSTSIGVAQGIILDEGTYIYKENGTTTSSGVAGARSVAKVIDDKTFYVKTSYSDTQNIIYRFGSLGINEITHLKEILLQNKTSDVLDDDFSGTSFTTINTDWISPYRIEALQNGNGNERLTTGGNHGTDGGGGGFATARPLGFKLFADGIEVKEGETVFAADKVVAKVTNRVSAFNAIDFNTGDKRDSLEEIVVYTFTPNVMAVNNEMIALENLKFHYYQGLGLTKSVWNKHLYMMEDNTDETVRDVSDNVAGQSGTYGDGVRANRIVLRNDGHAIAMYLDSDYGLGTLDYLNSSDKPIFYSATKVYGRTIGVDNTVDVNEGDSLTVAGGYALTQGLKCEGAEFAHKLSLKGKKAYAVDFFNAVNSTYLEVDEEDIGKEIKVWKKSDTITHDNFITSRGLKISASGYGQLVFIVE